MNCRRFGVSSLLLRCTNLNRVYTKLNSEVMDLIRQHQQIIYDDYDDYDDDPVICRCESEDSKCANKSPSFPKTDFDESQTSDLLYISLSQHSQIQKKQQQQQKLKQAAYYVNIVHQLNVSKSNRNWRFAFITLEICLRKASSLPRPLDSELRVYTQQWHQRAPHAT